MKFNVNTPEETMNYGEQLADYLSPKDVILLDGDLGAGKTTFTKGIAKGLGIKRNIKSPTFTIIREYQNGRLPLYHMDAYRLDDGSGDELGLEEYFNGDGVNVVEWSNFIEESLPKDYLKIIFKRDDSKGNNYRTIEFDPKGTHFNKIIEESYGKN
ncbi:tRNA (adenosine(37)-N6)-threonylcarbamoyltransferase complex ATPase subunit type 1 TsaE [Apilactobacillus apisilvae]|uniref:tRNA threonylcarbamoyladenosine biosynthesis protein TsaE n=1 Tax=Apilactobacillus apisilvae TaxID=2923364 RepID=A0ABY4PI42_9LACO|nr:tRNA (adenosine(37)-N6)-threonylcarbamoyltransferase complex ATPase subunit type 1 TsaE [Apilactobacillus apisilvae]UQS85096.1 tRNA (adenosine(37)-N6)-threonylcarbamoyltransferase complex ATPase subunit type 1 TsaE [Apilactobacillus apisilvae]